MMEQKYFRPPEFKVTKREDLPIVYVTGAFGGIAPNDARILFLADRLEPVPAEVPGTLKIKGINQEIQVEMHMSPATFKAIAEWMKIHLESYEKNFGEIKAEPIKEAPHAKESYVK